MKRRALVGLALCVVVSACSRREPSVKLSTVSSTGPAALGSAPAPVDPLAAQLRSPDDTARYNAAARAAQNLESPQGSADALNALFEILENAKEREGIRRWAARAVAKHDPERALKHFVDLTASGLSVDGDAWIALGPRAIPALRSRCTPADCLDPVFTELTLIVESAPSHDESRKAIPLLLRETTRSEQHKALAYRAFGAFGSSLVPELELLRNHDDPELRKAAAEALAAVRKGP